jgi:hypothetical protein
MHAHMRVQACIVTCKKSLLKVLRFATSFFEHGKTKHSVIYVVCGEYELLICVYVLAYFMHKYTLI